VICDLRVLWGKSPVEREKHGEKCERLSGEPVRYFSLHCNDKWATMGLDSRRMLGVGWCADGGCNRPSQSTKRRPSGKKSLPKQNLYC
jgi:hypothetical protein